LRFTISASEWNAADTFVITHMIDTCSSIFARIVSTVVDVGFTISASISRHANTSVVV